MGFLCLQHGAHWYGGHLGDEETLQSRFCVNMPLVSREALCSEMILAEEIGKVYYRGPDSRKLQLLTGFELIWGGNLPCSLESDLFSFFFSYIFDTCF